MKYDVTFTEQAENDLRGIFEYIAFDLLSPENAAGQLDRIEEKILSLGEYPEKFRQYEREPWKSRNTRVIGDCNNTFRIAVTTNNFWGYVLGVLGFGVAVVGCFLKDNH